MLCRCWPFKKAGGSRDLPPSENGHYKKTPHTTTFVNNEGSTAQKDELIDELRSQVQHLQGIANDSASSLKSTKSYASSLEIKLQEKTNEAETLETSNQHLKQELEEKNDEIQRLKEILASIRSSNQTQVAASKDRRKAVGGTKIETVVNLKKHEKTSEQRTFLRTAIINNDFLKHLDEEQVNEMIDYMQRSYHQNDVFIREGTNGDRLFILESGKLDVSQGSTYLARIEAGSVFGELALLYNCKRTATVTAKSPTKIWMLQRNVFQNIMMRTTNNKRTEVKDGLRKVPLMSQLNSQRLAKIADVVEEEVFQLGEYIIRQGESGDTFYMILSGEVDITVVGQEYSDSIDDPSPKEKYVRTLGKGDYFGEKALRSDSGLRGANVIAKTETVRCMTLDKKSFNQLIGNVADKNWDEAEKALTQNIRSRSQQRLSTLSMTAVHPRRKSRPRSSTVVDMPRRRMPSTLQGCTLNDFQFVGVLGVGGFGRVELVKYRNQPERTFALKCMKKTHIVETKQEEHIYSEKRIMRDSTSPFIVQLFRTFKNDKYVYMLMEACLGGELWTKLRDDGCFEDSRAKFYAACVIEAIEYLHLRGIVYRDLKPENLLIDQQGYVKIVDFGFAKSINHGEKAWTFCGTPEYVAPEVILNKGHDIAVDYWALGILIFEMLTGNPPFNSSDAMKTYRMALRGIDAIDWPGKIKRPAQNLIRRLCRENPAERIGNLREGVKEIKNSRWFYGFHWEGLRKRELKAPYIPEIVDTSDLRNFDRFEREDELVEKETSGWDKDF